MEKPVLGILLGDATGIGPELVAKVAASGFLSQYCRPVIIGDMRIFEQGLDFASAKIAHYAIAAVSEADWEKGIPVLDMADQDPRQITLGQINAYCGAACVRAIRTACALCQNGDIEGFCFAPFNKAALKLGGNAFESEHHLFSNIFGVTTPFGEINMLDDMMTVRTTSHIPIKDVSAHLSIESVMRAIELGWRTAKSMGIAQPRLGVAALNPHCGENGACGREELDVILPAIAKANELGMGVSRMYSSDILFYEAFKGAFDAVVTMYHDQGQIALKLMGFERGITVAGGQPYPIATAAHGTAYDLAGKGVARTTAFENAVKKTAQMANAKRAEKE